MKRITLLTATVLLTASPALADKCSGMLSMEQGELLLTNPRQEGICTFEKAEQDKVLHNCRLGRHCVIFGKVELCPDSGECVQVTHITKALKY